MHDLFHSTLKRLALRAEVGGALGDDLAGDQASAAKAAFDIAGFVVSFEMVVVLAQFPLQSAIAAEGSAAVFDARAEHRDNGFVQQTQFFRAQ